MLKRLLFVFLFVLSSNVNAEKESYGTTDTEMLMLPKFCAYRINANPKSKEVKVWKHKFGEMWLHIHHYCSGLNFKNRAQKSTDKNYSELKLNNSIKEFNYVINKVDSKHFYIPQILVDKGDVNKLLKNYGASIKNYTMAINLNKKFVPASVKLSRLYYKMGETQEAINVLEASLKYNPNSKTLAKKLKRYKNI